MKSSASNQAGTVLSLWSCQSATIENNNPSIAQLISKAHPNITVIGADGFVNYGVTSNNSYLISGVDTVKDSGRNDGFIVAYKNGVEVYRSHLENLKQDEKTINHIYLFFGINSNNVLYKERKSPTEGKSNKVCILT